jgi:hypothetical protein
VSLGYAAEVIDYLLMLFKGAVREVEAGAIQAGQKEGLQGFRLPGGRANGGDDFGLSHGKAPEAVLSVNFSLKEGPSKGPCVTEIRLSDD